MLIHSFTKERDRRKGIDTGEAKFHYEVASQTLCGENVYTLIIDGSGCYRTGDKVHVKAGREKYLESVNKQGQPTSTLYDLPFWED